MYLNQWKLQTRTIASIKWALIVIHQIPFYFELRRSHFCTRKKSCFVWNSCCANQCVYYALTWDNLSNLEKVNLCHAMWNFLEPVEKPCSLKICCRRIRVVQNDKAFAKICPIYKFRTVLNSWDHPTSKSSNHFFLNLCLEVAKSIWKYWKIGIIPKGNNVFQVYSLLQ